MVHFSESRVDEESTKMVEMSVTITPPLSRVHRAIIVYSSGWKTFFSNELDASVSGK